MSALSYLGVELTRPRVAFFELTSCEGCQLQIVNKEATLIDFLSLVEVVNFREAMSEKSDDYDIAFVEAGHASSGVGSRDPVNQAAAREESSVGGLVEVRSDLNAEERVGDVTCLDDLCGDAIHQLDGDRIPNTLWPRLGNTDGTRDTDEVPLGIKERAA